MNWINSHQVRASNQESYVFAVEEKNEQKLIGTVTLRLENSHKRAELA